MSGKRGGAASYTTTAASANAGVYNGKGAGAGIGKPNPFKMASQPLSLGEAFVQQQRYTRPLSAIENRALAEVSVDREQIVLCLPFPATMLEHGLGIPTISCLADITTQFYRPAFPDKNVEGQNIASRFNREMFLSVANIFFSLNAMSAGMIHIFSDPAVELANAEKLKELQRKFEAGDVTWFDLTNNGDSGHFMLTIESICDDTNTAIVGYRLVLIARGQNVSQRLVDMFNALLAYMTRRYTEERSYSQGLGHDSSWETPVDARKRHKKTVKRNKKNKKRKGKNNNGNNNGDGDPAQRLLDEFGMGGGGGGGGGDNGGEEEPDSDDSDAEPNLTDKQRFAEKGIDWNQTPFYRREKTEAILSKWETSILRLVKLSWATSGLRERDIESLFQHVWSGDKLMFQGKSAAQVALQGRSTISRVQFKTFLHFNSTGYMTKGNVRRDWKNMSPEFVANPNGPAAAMSQVMNVQPAHLFPMHTMTSWMPGNADSTQLLVANYFWLEADAEGTAHEIKGYPSANLHALLADEIERLRVVNEQKAEFMMSGRFSYGQISAMLLGTGDITEIGGRFKGFPYPERVLVLSPAFGQPWALPQIMLPPPDVDTLANAHVNWKSTMKGFMAESEGSAPRPYLYNVLRSMANYVPFLNAGDTQAFDERSWGNRASLVNAILYDNKSGINQVTSNPAYVSLIKDELPHLLMARMFIRYVATVTSGMLREWCVSESHKNLPEYGRYTLEATEVRTLIGGGDNMPLLATESESIEPDILNREQWLELLEYCNSAIYTRLSHTAHSVESQLEPIEVSPFVRAINTLSELLPWRTTASIIKASDEAARTAANASMFDIQFTDMANSGMFDNAETFDNYVWHHRGGSQAALGGSKLSSTAASSLGSGQDAEISAITSLATKKERIFTGEYPPGRTPLLHCGWRITGALANVQLDPHEEFRVQSSWQDVVCIYHSRLNLFVEHMVNPYMVYMSKFVNAPDNSRQGILRDACVKANGAIRELNWLFMCESLRPLMTNVTHNFSKDSIDRPKLSDAFREGLVQFAEHYGTTPMVQHIPFEEVMSRWSNLKDPNSIMCAHFSDTCMRLGIGQANTASTLRTAHVVRTSMTSSCVLTRQTARLGALNTLISSDTSIGKSYLLKTLLSMCVPRTYENVTSYSERAFDVPINCDGKFVCMDEGMSQVNSERKDDQSAVMLQVLKAMATNGFMVRGVCSTGKEAGDRRQDSVISSHRRGGIYAQNPGTQAMDPAYLSRLLVMIMKASFSPADQPLGHSFAARSGQTAAADDQQVEEAIEHLITFWRQHHACKIVIEQMIYMRAIRVETQTIVDYAHKLLAGAKDKLTYGGMMNRIHQLLSTITRNQVSDLMAWCVLMDWYEHRIIFQRSTDVPSIPMEFVLNRAAKYAYATKSTATYAISILFGDLVDNAAQMDIAKSLVSATGSNSFSVDYTKCFYATDIITDRSKTGSSGIASDDVFGGSESDRRRPDLDYVTYSDGHHVQRDPNTGKRRNHKHCLDLNYVVFDFGKPTYTQYINYLQQTMQSTKYGISQIKSIVQGMTCQVYTANDSNDYNRLAAHIYNDAIKRVAVGNMTNLRGRLVGINAEGNNVLASPSTASPGTQRAVNNLTNRAAARSNSNHDDIDNNNNNNGDSGNRYGSKNKNDDEENDRILCTDIAGAANQQLPLRYYRDGQPMPIAKWITLGTNKRDSVQVLVVHRKYLDEVAQTLQHGSNSADLPVVSTLLSIMSKKMFEMCPYPAYPPALVNNILNPALREKLPKEETHITSYVLDADGKFVADRVASAIASLEANWPLTAPARPAVLANILAALPAKLNREGAALAAQAPLSVKLNPAVVGKVVLSNMSANTPVLTKRSAHDEMLSRNDISTFNTRGYFDDPSRIDPKSETSKTKRMLTCYIERMRASKKIKRDNRVLAYDVDFESYLQMCCHRPVPVDPMDSGNVAALPHVYMILKKNRLAAADRERIGDVYPITDTQHQLKQRIYVEFYDAFSSYEEILDKFHPSHHSYETFDSWLLKLVYALSEAMAPLPTTPNVNRAYGARKRAPVTDVDELGIVADDD